MTYDEIVNILKKRKNDINPILLKYISNYLFVLFNRDVLPSSLDFDTLIDKLLYYISDIVFYGCNHEVYKQKGKDVKGFIDKKNRLIYVRDNLDDCMKEMIVYHEIHHAAQLNSLTNRVGINYKSNIGRLIMEGQTQYFAEEVYKTIHDVDFSEKDIPSEKLNMVEGGVVVSSLHNYELYDNVLTKLAIVLDVPKDFFVSINFMYDDNKGFELLKEKYILAKEKYNLSIDFDELMLLYDYICCVKVYSYIENPDKNVILSGGVTGVHAIHPHKGMALSLKNQFCVLAHIDGTTLVDLTVNDGNYKEYTKYVVDNYKRDLGFKYIEAIENENKKLEKK